MTTSLALNGVFGRDRVQRLDADPSSCVDARAALTF